MAELIIGGAIALLLILTGISIFLDLVETYHNPKSVTDEFKQKEPRKRQSGRVTVDAARELEEISAE